MRTAVYWTSTLLVSIASILAAISYLMAAPQAVAAFTHVGYPQQLRVMLGIAKPLGAVVLLIPGVPTIKEWAYAGFGFAWIAAIVAHYLARRPYGVCAAVVACGAGHLVWDAAGRSPVTDASRRG